MQRDTGSIAVVAVIDVDAVRVLDDVVLVGSRVVDLVGTSVVGTSVVGTSVVGTDAVAGTVVGSVVAGRESWVVTRPSWGACVMEPAAPDTRATETVNDARTRFTARKVTRGGAGGARRHHFTRDVPSARPPTRW